MKTQVRIQGMANGQKHTVMLVQEGTPEQLFNGRSLQELFKANTGFQPEGKLDLEVTATKQTGFGETGFSTDDMDSAVIEGRRLSTMSDKELGNMFLKQLPSPEEMIADGMVAFAVEDHKRLMTIAKTFELASNIAEAPISIKDFIGMVEKEVDSAMQDPVLGQAIKLAIELARVFKKRKEEKHDA
jgi:hypothetical protein